MIEYLARERALRMAQREAETGLFAGLPNY